MATFLPNFVSKEDNEMIMEEVTINELQGILAQFKIDKCLNPDRIPVEFYLVLFDVLAIDLLLGIE